MGNAKTNQGQKMKSTLTIGRREYQVIGTEEKVNNFGQAQTWTDLRGKRGAEVVLVETRCKYGVSATLIHFGRMNPRETVDASLIRR